MFFTNYLDKLKNIFSSEKIASYCHSHCITDVGLRRKTNEDACFCSDKDFLWVVADGMGGHDAGDWASQTIVESLEKISLKGDLKERIHIIKETLQQINHKIYQTSVERGQRIGSTVVVLHLYYNQIACLWAGDSRLYRWRGNQLKQLTQDHSLVANLVKEGLIPPEEAQSHPAANIITRAVGVDKHILIDTYIEEVKPKDRWLLCTDGLGKDVSDQKIADLWQETHVPDEMTKSLIKEALAHSGRDNITVCVVQTD